MFQYFKTGVAAAARSAAMEAANHSKNSAMEAENHVKHGACSKSLMSRGNQTAIVVICLIFGLGAVISAQIPTPEIKINVDDKGVAVGTYYVSFYKRNSCDYSGTISFDFYLSYNGKRVSDYYHMSFCISGRHGKNAITWPNAVPKGHEKYVTVQLGKEPPQKDRRDDS